LFPRYYGARFTTTGNAWYDASLFEYDGEKSWEVTT
jgi:hypothetical protein